MDSPRLFARQRVASGGLDERAAESGHLDLRSRVATSQSAVSERRAGGLADATRRRQTILAHRGSGGAQALQRRCWGHGRRTEVLKTRPTISAERGVAAPDSRARESPS